MNLLAKAVIMFEEGFRSRPYKDSEGYPTIGYGTKIGTKDANIDNYVFMVEKKAAAALLEQEVDKVIGSLSMLPFFPLLSEERQAVIVSMAYQMGVEGVKGFRKMIEALEDENYTVAASEALDSKWAHQTPLRAERHAEVLRTGEFSDDYANAIMSNARGSCL